MTAEYTVTSAWNLTFDIYVALFAVRQEYTPTICIHRIKRICKDDYHFIAYSTTKSIPVGALQCALVECMTNYCVFIKKTYCQMDSFSSWIEKTI